MQVQENPLRIASPALGAEIELILNDPGAHWRAELRSTEENGSDETNSTGEILIRLFTCDASEQPPPECFLCWSIPQIDIMSRWSSNLFTARHLPPNWAGKSYSQLANNAPVMTLLSLSGENRLTFAFSDAYREVEFHAGVDESNCHQSCSVRWFRNAEAPLACYEARLRIDRRKIFYADAVRSAFAWFEGFDNCRPAEVPEAAFDPVYSSWYSYHKADLYADRIEKELELAAEYGLKTVIVDDGWQCDRYDGGAYAYCGDWQPVERRFPDMKRHVAKVHACGLKYVLWYSVPFAGVNSEIYRRFKDRCLYCRSGLGAWVLDPRFPEVRDYLISIYETAVRNWDLDGFKLDFIDSFPIGYENDPAPKQNFAGRDCKTVPEGVDRLMTETMRRLRLLKKEILIEFRQSYIGPAIRKYGNMLRAGDCPADALSNRIRTIDLRLSSGRTAVHSDMLAWDAQETAVSAARQLLAVLFSVPQISVRLEELSPEQSEMLHSWLNFCAEHRSLLLHGNLRPMAPEHLYPLVYTERENECLAALYEADRSVSFALSRFECCHLVNASGSDSLLLETDCDCDGEAFDVFGKSVGAFFLPHGLARVSVPDSGRLLLKRRKN